MARILKRHLIVELRSCTCFHRISCFRYLQCCFLYSIHGALNFKNFFVLLFFREKWKWNLQLAKRFKNLQLNLKHNMHKISTFLKDEFQTDSWFRLNILLLQLAFALYFQKKVTWIYTISIYRSTAHLMYHYVWFSKFWSHFRGQCTVCLKG